MKILFLTPRDSEKNLGGVEGHVRILRKELVKRGHQIRELSLDRIAPKESSFASWSASTPAKSDPSGFGRTGDFFRRKKSGPSEELSLDESIKVTPCFARCHLFKLRAWGYLWEKLDLFKWADVIHVHDVFWWYIPFAIVNKGLALLQDCHVPLKAGLIMTKTLVFVTFHGWEGVCPPSWSAVWQKRVAQKLSQGTIGVGNFFEKWYGVTPNKVVYGALDSDCHVRQNRTRNDGLSVVFFGRLEEVNGIEILLSALKVTPWLRPRCNLSRLVFVGDGSYRKQAEKFGKVTGMVRNPQKYLVDADVVITSSYMSMLEAAAMGKPIIAVANSELKQDYLDGHPLRKYFVVCKNYKELAGRIASLQLRKDAIRSARDWAVKQTAKRLADIYEGLWKKHALSFRTRSGIYLNRFPLSRE